MSAERYFGSNTNDLTNPVGLQEWSYAYDNIGNRTASARADAISEYAANLLNQYTGRTVPGYADIIGTANTGINVTVNNQAVTRQSDYWSKRLSVDNETNAVYENINVVGVYSPGGTNDDIVTTVTGKMFVAETPEHFTYDADGNLLSDGRWNYVWDAENRLVAMSTLTNLCPSVPLLLCHFSYDYMSRRIGKTVYNWISNDWQAVSATTFLYDGWNLVQELITDDGSLITNSYICGLDLSGSLQGAGGVGGLLSAVIGTNSVCYTFDANGNVSEILQVSGFSPQPLILAHYEYSPYGEQLVAVGPLARDNPFRFSTKYTDNETRLVYYGYRYYHPGMGRWVNQEPLGERGGFNLYCLVENSVYNSFDVLGLLPLRTENYKKELEVSQLFSGAIFTCICTDRGNCCEDKNCSWVQTSEYYRTDWLYKETEYREDKYSIPWALDILLSLMAYRDYNTVSSLINSSLFPVEVKSTFSSSGYIWNANYMAAINENDPCNCLNHGLTNTREESLGVNRHEGGWKLTGRVDYIRI